LKTCYLIIRWTGIGEDEDVVVSFENW
jgi:hypothetical protein